MQITRLAIPALAACAALAVSGAAARSATATLSYPPSAASASIGNPTIASIVYLPGTGPSGIYINFVLPADYRRNSTVEIEYYLSGPSDCKARLVPQQLLRQRPGRPMFEGPAALTGVGGPVVGFGPGHALKRKVFRVEPDAGFPGQRAGDGMLVAVMRDTTHPGDTCVGSINVTNIAIRYEKANG